MLWVEFTFTVDDRDSFRKSYQEKFFKMLTPESSKNFIHTRELHLRFSFGSAMITNSGQCSSIKTVVDKLVRIYEYTEPYLHDLSLKIEPFVPSNCENESLWPLLNSCNDSIYNCLGQIAHRQTDFPIFLTEIGRRAWQFDIEYRAHLQQILWLLAPKITTLEISESPFFLNGWLPTMKRLRSLIVENVGATTDDDFVAMWKAFSTLPLKRLSVNGFKFPNNLPSYVSQTLTSVFLNGVDDVVAACTVCYTQLRHLERCGLNSGKATNPNNYRSITIRNTVCTKLVQVCFFESMIPVGLVATIARRNPQLKFCGAPPNISDDDVLHLRKHCPRLSMLRMSVNLNDVLPQFQLTKVGLAEISRMMSLQDLKLHYSHVGYLDRTLLLAIAGNCCLLGILQFSKPQDSGSGGNWGELDVRACLVGSEEFKDWFLRLDYKERFGNWEISLCAMREDASLPGKNHSPS